MQTVEPLESRRLWSAASFYEPFLGLLYVRGTDAADNVVVTEDQSYQDLPDGKRVFAPPGRFIVTDTAAADPRTGRQVTATKVFDRVRAIVLDLRGGDDVVEFYGKTVGATIFAGAGNDNVSVSDNLVLEPDAPRHLGTSRAASRVFAGDGDDTVIVYYGNDTKVNGGRGNDLLLGSHYGNTTLDGAAGDDTVGLLGEKSYAYGGTGADTLYVMSGWGAEGNSSGLPTHAFGFEIVYLE